MIPYDQFVSLIIDDPRNNYLNTKYQIFLKNLTDPAMEVHDEIEFQTDKKIFTLNDLVPESEYLLEINPL